jgi:hypothetical protein
MATTITVDLKRQTIALNDNIKHNELAKGDNGPIHTVIAATVANVTSGSITVDGQAITVDQTGQRVTITFT